MSTMNWVLDNDQLDEIKATFLLLDKDNDGKIGLEDMKVIMHSYGQYLNDKEVTDMLAEVDCDGSYTIDIYEFMAFLSRCCKEHNKDEEMMEIFHLLDKDGDSKLSVDDLKAAFTLNNEELTDDDINKIYSEYDQDHDGFLTYAEFSKFIFDRK